MFLAGLVGNHGFWQCKTLDTELSCTEASDIGAPSAGNAVPLVGSPPAQCVTPQLSEGAHNSATGIAGRALHSQADFLLRFSVCLPVISHS
jgi:hypothetical protein